MDVRRRTWQRTVLALAALLLTLAASRVAAADTISLMWDASPDSTVTGYILYVGTQPGTYSQNFNVGSATSYAFTTAVAGQQYCFAVSAYVPGPVEGAKSPEVCGYSDERPTLTNPGAQSSTAGQSDTLQLVGSDPDGLAVTYSATGLPQGLTLGTSTGFIQGTPTTAGSYSVTATVFDGVLTASQTFSWNVAAGDTTAPTVTITTPTTSTTHATSSATLNLGGTAADAVGVTQVSWTNDRGGNGIATGTTNWSVTGITLQSGANVITVTARDAANNTRTDSLTVTYSALDTTAPVATITAPTSVSTYTATTTPLTVSGTASDAVGVTQVTWANNRGGSGTATGTTSWSVSGIVLQDGSNIITITARDAAGNTAADALTVTYNAPDTTAPVATITTPTLSSSFTASTSPFNISGTASDAVGVTQVTWANNRGGSGTATGTASWSVSGIVLQDGSNIITITARDAAGNTAADALTVTYNAPDTTAPVATITTPTLSSSFTASTSPFNISGTASDAVGVTQVTWANNRGGSGTATGTASWSVSGIVLQDGSNVISITARDAAGNSGADTVTVTYNAPDTTNPSLTITGPTSSATHATSTTPLTVSGTASDNVGVTQVTWANDRGGSGTASGTTSWTAIGLALQSGANVITVTARDAAGNTVTDTLTVTYTPLDTTSPAVAISAPTTAASYVATGATLSLSGTASDNVGLTMVTWANNRGGNGNATGTTSWGVSGVALQSGPNVITITARDTAGNTATDTLTVDFTPPLALSSLTANLAAPQVVGTPITFTATAINGTAPYSYKWWVFDGTTWTILQNWSASNTYTWTPLVANSAFRVAVWVRSAGSTTDAYDNPQSNGSVAFPVNPAPTPTPLVLTSLTANLSAPQPVGTPITFNATATGGIGPYQYKWWVSDGKNWTEMRTWSTSSTWTWTPTSAGGRTRVAVWVRSAGSTVDAYDNPAANGSIEFGITGGGGRNKQDR